MNIDLKTFGWDEFFKTKFESWAGRDYTAGRVALEHRNLFRVYTEHGEVLAELSGKLRHEATSRSDLPAAVSSVTVVIRTSHAVRFGKRWQQERSTVDDMRAMRSYRKS